MELFMASDRQNGIASRGAAGSEAAFRKEVESLAAEVSKQARQLERQENAPLQADDAAVPKSAMTLEQALKSESPDARSFVADHFMRLNLMPGPQLAKKFYRVDDQEPVEAYDEIDAIAVTNDRTHSLKGPHGRKVVEIQRELATIG
jgi:hypothetical protein